MRPKRLLGMWSNENNLVPDRYPINAGTIQKIRQSKNIRDKDCGICTSHLVLCAARSQPASQSCVATTRCRHGNLDMFLTPCSIIHAVPTES